MKKKLLILLGISVILCAAVLVILLAPSKGMLEIYAADGTLLVRLDETTINDPMAWPADSRSYIDIALNEAVQILTEEKGCTPADGRKLLAEDGYRLDTAYDSTVQAAITAAYRTYSERNLEMGCAVTDLHGKLLAAFSSHEDQNYATAQTPPYSSFKPLSVYAPALEAGIIHFSSTFADSPVSQVAGEPWPSNSSNRYKNAPVTVAQAVQISLNTVAVRCMDALGLERSFAFLEESFDLELTGEKARAQQLGTSEVRGNIALGHLDIGVSPVQMAGYYQCFGNGGKYAAVRAVTALRSGSGTVLYDFSYDPAQVLSPENAAVMNRLLQQVTTPAGTGADAFDPAHLTAGKTGTGTLGNWFIGVTPSYSCAVWHGTQLEKNTAAAIFAQIREGLPAAEMNGFPSATGMTETLYCMDSGLQATGACRQVGIGIYATGQTPPACNIEH